MARAARQRASGLSTRQLVVAILFVAIFAMAVRSPTDTDTWWHLKSGQRMWETGQLLRTDPFSHTVFGQPWINHGWLVQILLWPIWRGLGLPGLSLLLAMVVTATFSLVYAQCEGKPYVAALAVLLGSVTSSVVWAMRPQIVSVLFTSCLAFLLHRYKKSGNSQWLWPVPVLVVLWVNSHGGYVIAFLLMGAYLLGELLNRVTKRSPTAPQVPLKPLIGIIAVSIPAVLLNPNTVKMIPYAFQTISIGQLQDYIQEWGTPDFHKLQFHPFIWLLFLTVASMGLSRRRADWTDLVLLSLFGYMSLLAVRNIALFAVVIPPILTRHVVPVLDDLASENPRLSWLAALTHTLGPPLPRRSISLLNALLLVVILVGAGAKVVADLVRLREPEVWGQGLPLGAAEFLRQHELPGRMFNSYNWGGYLIWSLYPDNPVFVDGRTDLYALNSQVLEDYSQVHWLRPDWPLVLERYGIGYILTERTGLLDVSLAQTQGWDPIYQDNVAIIYSQTVGTQ